MSDKTVIVPWCCPQCRQQLAYDGLNVNEGLLCQECEKLFLLRDGMPNFVGDNFAMFYEERGEIYHYPKLARQSYPLKTRLAMFFADDDFSTNHSFLRRVMRHPNVVIDIRCSRVTLLYLNRSDHRR